MSDATTPADGVNEAPAPKRRGRPPKAAEPAPAPATERFPKTFGERLLAEVDGQISGELDRQYDKWGPRDHPIHGGESPSKGQVHYAQRALDWKAINDQRVEGDTMGWDSILLEEVFEALGESDPEKIEEELVQVIAVAANAIDSLRRNGR